MDYNRNKKYFESKNLKGAIITMKKKLYFIMTSLVFIIVLLALPSPAISSDRPELPKEYKSIHIVPGDMTLVVGQTWKFSVEGIYGDDRSQDITSLATWEIEPNTIKIENDGSVTASEPGEYFITASRGNLRSQTARLLVVTQFVSRESKLPAEVKTKSTGASVKKSNPKINSSAVVKNPSPTKVSSFSSPETKKAQKLDKDNNSTFNTWSKKTGNGTIIENSPYHHKDQNKKSYEVDIDGKVGDPVKPYKGGTVYDVKDYGKKGTGNTIIIKDKDGNTYTYGHLDKIEVKKGVDVTTDTEIGKIGRTGKVIPIGKSDGSHLHFEKRDNKGNLVHP